MKILSNKELIVDEPVPVYDLEVNHSCHNFSLDNNVVVHNCLVGAPGKGKSKLMSYLAYAGLLQNRHVVYISCELKEPAVMSNIVQCATGFTMMDIMDPAKREIYLAKAEKIKRLAPHLKAIYYPNKTVNINNIRTYLTKLQTIEDFKPGLIIVDYADLLNPVAKPLGNNYEDCGNIFYDLCYLADIYECPVVTGSQLGRHVWNQIGDEVITQDTLADSAKKAHVAYSIISLNQNMEETHKGLMRLFTAKVRRGKTLETIYCKFDKNINLVKEIPPYDPKNLAEVNV